MGRRLCRQKVGYTSTAAWAGAAQDSQTQTCHQIGTEEQYTHLTTQTNTTRCHIPNAEFKNVVEKNSRPMGFDDDQIENLERDHKKNQGNRVIPDLRDAYV